MPDKSSGAKVSLKVQYVYKFRNSYRLNNPRSHEPRIERKTGFENESSSERINRDISRLYVRNVTFSERRCHTACREARSFKCEISLASGKCWPKHWWICKPFIQVNAKLQAGGSVSIGVVLALTNITRRCTICKLNSGKSV